MTADHPTDDDGDAATRRERGAGGASSSRVVELEAEVAALRAQVVALAARLEDAVVRPRSAEASVTRDAVPTGSRRALLLGGIGAAVGAAATVVGSTPAAAATGAMQFGAANLALTDSTTLSSSAASSTLTLTNSGAGAGLRVTATGSTGVSATTSAAGAAAVLAENAAAGGVAVAGVANDGIGVRARADAGSALEARTVDGVAARLIAETGAVALLTTTSVVNGPPTTGFWPQGSVLAPADGSLWFCTEGGTPGQWLRLSARDAAGQFTAVTPGRAYDSRFNAPVGKLVSGASRVVPVGTAYSPGTTTVSVPDLVPPGATAVALNLTVTGTTGGGYLFVGPGDLPVPTGSSINWSSTGTTLANALTVKLDADRQLKVFASTGSSSHFIVDVLGYYL